MTALKTNMMQVRTQTERAVTPCNRSVSQSGSVY